MSHPHHAIDYIELSVTDVGEAKRFYSGRRFHFADPSGNELAVWASR